MDGKLDLLEGNRDGLSDSPRDTSGGQVNKGVDFSVGHHDGLRESTHSKAAAGSTFTTFSPLPLRKASMNFVLSSVPMGFVFERSLPLPSDFAHGSALLVLDQGLAASTFQIQVDLRRDERPVFVHNDHVVVEHLAVFRAGAFLRVHSQPALWVRHLKAVDAGDLKRNVSGLDTLSKKAVATNWKATSMSPGNTLNPSIS